ncbi:MAG: serine hydrolase [Tannerella sp.]|nr:serine hydrolase [Tannerella sp.]
MKYFLVGVLIACFTVTEAFSKEERELKMRIASVLEGKKATVGIAVFSEDNQLLEINKGDYPMMSVCKFPLALAVLDYLHKNNLSLDTEIFVRKSDLLPDTYSPLRDRHPQGNIKMSIRELLSYTVSLSDNNACDILFGYIGGTKVVDDYIKRLGISGMSVVATEAVMHESFEKQYCIRLHRLLPFCCWINF